jgi:hypothetical protein
MRNPQDPRVELFSRAVHEVGADLPRPGSGKKSRKDYGGLVFNVTTSCSAYMDMSAGPMVIGARRKDMKKKSLLFS